MPGKCTFNARWPESKEYCSWLTRTSEVNKARCKLCLKDFDIGAMGESSVSSPGDHDADVGSETSTADQNSASTSGDHDVTTERKTSFATTAETLAAEVLWALKVTTSHYSHHSCEETGDTFRTMFPDSRIAAKLYKS